MDIVADEDGVHVRLSRDEAFRLFLALRAGWETVSTAEYYIRHGLSQPNIEAVAGHLRSLAEARTGRVSIPLEVGVEAVENPRRPRPQE
jgi:hypothetical protein